MLYDGISGEMVVKRKYCVPDPITTPKRGPLLLFRPGQEETRTHHKLTDGNQVVLLPRKPNKRSLTRFPVPMIQRPLQQIENDLGQLTCTVLQDTMNSMETSFHTKRTVLPHLHPMMKYSPINNGLHGNKQTPPPTWHKEYHTHRENRGNMGVSITYSRHSVLRPSSTQPHLQTTSQDTGQTLLLLGHNPLNQSHTTLLHTPSQVHITRDNPVLLQDQITDSYLNHQTMDNNDWGNQYSLPPSSSSLLVPPISGSSLAPPSLQAVVTHRKKPLTQHTTLRGRRIQNS